MNTEIKTVETQNFKMRYFRFGSINARPLAILPGLSIKSVMESSDAIKVQYGELAKEHDIYVFDRRMDISAPYSVFDMASDTLAVFDALGIKNADIFGVSQGGMIALALAIKRPGLCHRLVLGSTAARIPKNAELIISDWIRLAKIGDRYALMSAFAASVYSEGFFEKYHDAIIALANSVTDEELRRFSYLAGGTRNFDVFKDLDCIKCPALVIGADCDKIFGEESSAEIAKRLKCELLIYEGYPHAVYDEAPDYVNRLCDFFDPEDR